MQRDPKERRSRFGIGWQVGQSLHRLTPRSQHPRPGAFAIDPFETEAQRRVGWEGQHHRPFGHQADGLIGGGQQPIGDDEHIVICLDQTGQTAKILDRLKAYASSLRAVLAGDDILPQPPHQANHAFAAQIDRAIELMRKDRTTREDSKRALASLVIRIVSKSSKDGDAQRWRVSEIGMISKG